MASWQGDIGKASMYIIEMHRSTSAHAQIIIEKGDTAKTYEEFAKHRVIINHAGDVDIASCKWCLEAKRARSAKEVIAL